MLNEGRLSPRAVTAALTSVNTLTQGNCFRMNSIGKNETSHGRS